MAALSLVRDGIPTTLAAYNNQGMVLSTPSLAMQELAMRTLEIVKELNTRENTVKALNPPDVGRYGLTPEGYHRQRTSWPEY